MRAYFMQNMYLQGIHAGIQSQHTTAEMFVKYKDEIIRVMSYDDRKNMQVEQRPIFKPNPEGDMLKEWARDHKTTIILNGGYMSNLQLFKEMLEQYADVVGLPWAHFNESEQALGGALTNVGVILPERIYIADPDTQDGSEAYQAWRNLDMPEKMVWDCLRKLKLMS